MSEFQSQGSVFETDLKAHHDSSRGFSKGFQWINKNTGEEFTCVNNEPNAAVWRSVGGSKMLVTPTGSSVSRPLGDWLGPLSEGEYLVYDDFGGPVGPLNGRAPKTGGSNWKTTGAGHLTATAGEGTYTSNGNTYAVMELAETPWEIGGVFEAADVTASEGAIPTISCIKDEPSHNFSVMWHVNLNPRTSVSSWSVTYWDAVWNGAASDAVGVHPVFGSGTPGFSLQPNTRYRLRYFYEAPFADYLIETLDGAVLATYRTYDPRMGDILGRFVFFQSNNSSMKWHEVWARKKPTDGSLARRTFRGGLDATPVGRTMPASAAFTNLHVGPGAPKGVLSARFTANNHHPVVIGSSVTAIHEVKAEGTGLGSESRATNAAGAYGSMRMQSSFVHSLSVNGTDWLSKSWNGDAFFSVPLRLGGATGPRVMSGAGSPEGVVTAPVGSIYTRTDGGAATTLYVKESGTGNTGWIAK